MNFIKNLTPENRKLIKEVGVLLIVLLLFIVFSVYINKADETTIPAVGIEQINPEFNTSALPRVLEANSNLPVLNTNNVGRANPFGSY